jgi:hypothetical protein
MTVGDLKQIFILNINKLEKNTLFLLLCRCLCRRLHFRFNFRLHFRFNFRLDGCFRCCVGRLGGGLVFVVVFDLFVFLQNFY